MTNTPGTGALAVSQRISNSGNWGFFLTFFPFEGQVRLALIDKRLLNGASSLIWRVALELEE
jgi:hypothetical protein